MPAKFLVFLVFAICSLAVALVGMLGVGMIDWQQLFGLAAASGFVSILGLTCALAMTGRG
ncbi:MAG: hypothetical protein AAGH60_01110 [Pseudomonadota bacterium]